MLRFKMVSVCDGVTPSSSSPPTLYRAGTGFPILNECRSCIWSTGVRGSSRGPLAAHVQHLPTLRLQFGSRLSVHPAVHNLAYRCTLGRQSLPDACVGRPQTRDFALSLRPHTWARGAVVRLPAIGGPPPPFMANVMTSKAAGKRKAHA